MDLEAGKFLANFFTEWSCQEDAGGTEESLVRFKEIEEIIKDFQMIARLEKELRGEVRFEEGWRE